MIDGIKMFHRFSSKLCEISSRLSWKKRVIMMMEILGWRKMIKTFSEVLKKLGRKFYYDLLIKNE